MKNNQGLGEGEVVSEWQTATLTDVCTNITYGYTASANLNGIGPKFLRITDIVPSQINWGSVPNCVANDKDIEKYKLKDGDIVIARTGATTGYNKYIKNLKHEAVFASYLIRYQIDKNKAFPEFVGHTLKSSNWYDYVDAIAGGSAQPGANAKQLGSFEFSLPPIEEQKSIASVLSSLDDKIDLLHRQNTTLERMAETLFRQWFVEEVQEDWKEATLKDEFDFTMGQSPSGSSFNEEGIGIPMFQGNADFGFRFPTERVYTTEPARFADPMDTLVSVRAPVGAQNMAKFKCCIGRGVAAFRYKKNDNFYTYTYYKIRSLMEEIKQFNDEGTVFGSISKSDFENLTITIPKDIHVIKFENEAKPINDKIIKNCEQIQTLEKLRDNLLPKLISGKIRMKNG